MTATPDLDAPEAPALLHDDELRETIDLMATAVASMSNRIDGLTKVANKQFEVSTEARIAAFAARDQTTPKKYGKLLAATVGGKIDVSLARMSETCADLSRASKKTEDVLRKAEQDQARAYHDLFEREQKMERFKYNLPWLGICALVLALAMTVLLPYFLASHPFTCAILGATWTTTTEGTNACVFYQR